ncbi:MAG: dephospho-CoA kinase [Myxococcota bacterium]|nr:dephospho-CoA kinase [Myxococcota bacterium]
MKNKPKLVGLTGGIASGKSTVASFFREASVPVIDADKLGHLVLEKGGAAYEPVIAAFGNGILNENKEIDRKKLGAIVFEDPKQRGELEAITHPAIAALAKRGIQMIAERKAPIAVYEAALLVETGIYKGLDALIVVSCSVATQMARIIARDGFDREAAAVRIASQFPIEEKLAVADYVIRNEGPMDQTRVDAMNILAELRKRFKSNADG